MLGEEAGARISVNTLESIAEIGDNPNLSTSPSWLAGDERVCTVSDCKATAAYCVTLTVAGVEAPSAHAAIRLLSDINSEFEITDIHIGEYITNHGWLTCHAFYRNLYVHFACCHITFWLI